MSVEFRLVLAGWWWPGRRSGPPPAGWRRPALMVGLSELRGWMLAMAVPSWLEHDERIVGRHHRPGSAGTVAAWPEWLPDDVRSRLEASGLPAPWAHQVALAEHVFAGRHAAISTGTASGKTLAYLMPVLAATASTVPVLGVPVEGARATLSRRPHTALYLAPTKALAHDQYRVARGLGGPQWRVGTLDGDSEEAERRFAREVASYVLTNPDMLHRSVLPNHGRWAALLGSLRYVVVDEAHRYRGVFGAQVANVVRRLRRLCASYGAHPTFVLASATSTRADQTGGALIGEPSVDLVDVDLSPHASRDVLLWQPDTSVASETSWLLARLVDEGRQTIAFVGSRAQSELVSLRAQDLVTGPGRIAGYRAGYLADDRRKLEAALQSGALAGVAATNALELGIDVSGMDAVLVAGFPGTMAALWQQVGRAGRGTRDALAIVLGREDPLDAYLFSHPELIFETPVEQTVLHPTNPHVMGPHLAAAAQEMALTDADSRWFGPSMTSVADALDHQGVLRRRPQGWFWTRADRAVDHIDLRSMGGRSLDVVEAATGRVLGQVEPSAADRTVHPGAVYLHQGEQWLVTEYLPEEQRAMVASARPGYYTQPQSLSEVRVLTVSQQRPFGPPSWGATVSVGDVETTEQVVGYLRRDEITHEVWDQNPLHLPERRMRTRSMWWQVPPALVQALGMDARLLASAAHAAEHTAIGLLPMFAPCDRWDIGGLSTVLHPDTGCCTIFVHDGHPGGAGFAERGFTVADQWLRATVERLETCPCTAGCPSCVVSPKCGNANQFLDKEAALLLVRALLGLGEPRSGASRPSCGSGQRTLDASHDTSGV